MSSSAKDEPSQLIFLVSISPTNLCRDFKRVRGDCVVRKVLVLTSEKLPAHHVALYIHATREALPETLRCVSERREHVAAKFEVAVE